LFWTKPFFCGTGIWTQVFTLARHVSYHLSHTPLYCFVLLLFRKGLKFLPRGQHQTAILLPTPLLYLEQQVGHYARLTDWLIEMCPC
jgi:hypothetical protein